MFEKVVSLLERGVSVNSFKIFVHRKWLGKIRGITVLDIFTQSGSEASQLAYVMLFKGKNPYYRPFVEFYGIVNQTIIGKKRLKYFDSEIENFLLRLYSKQLSGGDKIFVEYTRDLRHSRD